MVVQVKLLPTPDQAAALTETLHACNVVADWVSQVAFDRRVFSRAGLQKLLYLEVKARGLSAQPALHVIRKTADAYTTRRAQITSGLLGKPGSARRAKAEGKPITFRPDAAHPFDDRCLSWQTDVLTVSIWTTRGRIKNLRFTGEPSQLKTLAEHRKGESDLVYRTGKWFLVATCEIPEPPLNTRPRDWIGVDRGIVNLATTSDGVNHQGRSLQHYRRRMARVRAKLQVTGTKSAKRKLKRRARREQRHTAHVNHKIAKTVVADAQRTGRGIALEDLQGIRDRVWLKRHQRATLSSWSFHQLGEFIAYKARRAGVPVLEVDAAYTSQICPRCRHVCRKNRPTREEFRCVLCGLAGPADHIAAVNVRARARTVWAFVNTPHAAMSPSPGLRQS
ncbi:RNA-guided endonuclease InsQ/TnpB family protein [Actinomadura formosensis]|uniref:RNA-guided endonuclease InsQ/TnpB family protein n=1 Tax=Actinomadura formosensis TaxID=60706 RepID=UPI000A430EFD|nr:RNA-guided endonuclease TnpB family protein [Actinomadura formosensis]